MEDFFKALFSALSAELPFMAVLIIGAAMWLFGSTGIFVGGGKIDNRVRKTFRFLGATLTFLGVITTLITVSLFFWKFVQPYQSYLSDLWAAISKVLWTLVFILVVTSVGMIVINYFRKKQIEKGYKLQSKGVVEFNQNSSCREAHILVQNVGKGKITCAAQLKKVIQKDLQGEEEPFEIDVDFLNPNGFDLAWGKANTAYITLSEGERSTVRLLRSHYHGGTYEKEMVFLFLNSEESLPWGLGYYTIQVDFLRWDGAKSIKLDTFEGVLEVGPHLLSWKDKEE